MPFENPIYETDIKVKEMRVVSLGNVLSGEDEHGLVAVDLEVIEIAANQAVDLLTDVELRRESVEHNIRSGKESYSMKVLHKSLHHLIAYQG